MQEDRDFEIQFLRDRINTLELENREFRRSVTVAEFPRVLGPRLEGLNTLWIGPCHIEGFSVFADRVGCSAQHLLYSSFPFEEVAHFDASKFDCIVVGLTLRNLLRSTGGEDAPDFQHLRPDWNEDNIESFFSNCHLEMVRQIDNIYASCNGKPTFFVPFLEPSFNFSGNLLRTESLVDIGNFVAKLNQCMRMHLSQLSSCYILDINEMADSVGRMHLQDDVITYYTHAVFIGDFDVDLDEKIGRIISPVRPTSIYDSANRWRMLNEVLWSRLLDNVKILRGIDAVKLIIVDLDDTMWRGIAADQLPDDIDNEEYFRTIGWPMALAEALLYFKKRGGLIAICSKNDHDTTVKRFSQLWGNRIKIEDFCAVRINWERKSENIASILKDVSLLPESVVFIDDNPREIDEVKRELPGIRCLGFQHYDWRRIILQAPEMQVPSISNESQQRTNLIQAKIEREKAVGQGSREEWLAALDIRVKFNEVRSVEDTHYARAVELLNKTNQFNTTGKRWTSDEMNTVLDQGGFIVTITAIDKHADNGVVGIAVVQNSSILQVVLSCRVFGLGIEDIFLYHLVGLLKATQKDIFAEEKETDRNLVSRDYFTRSGFVKNSEGTSVLDRNATLQPPKWISIIN